LTTHATVGVTRAVQQCIIPEEIHNSSSSAANRLSLQQIIFDDAPVEHLKAPFTLMLVDLFMKSEHRKWARHLS
jgi:hypothetical protein